MYHEYYNKLYDWNVFTIYTVLLIIILASTPT